jgi:hypothetical protein
MSARRLSRPTGWPVLAKRGKSTVTIHKADGKKNHRLYTPKENDGYESIAT